MRKKSNQEFRVILEWSKGSVTKDHKRDGVIGIYSSFKEGWSGDLDSSKLKLVAAKESSLDAHGESNAHLYYGSKLRTWEGWSSTDLHGWAVSDTKVNTWEDGTFSTKFTVELDG